MPIIIDIVIVAILAIFLIVGIKRGFLLMLLPLLSIVLAIVLGFALKGPIRSLLNKTPLESKIAASVTNLVQKALDKNDSGEASEDVSKESGSAENAVPGEENAAPGEEGSETAAEAIVETNKEEGEKAVKDTGIPKYIADLVRKWAANNADEVYGKSSDTAAILGSKVASFIMDLIAFLIIAVVVIIVLLIVKLIIKSTRELNVPVLHQLGSLGGGIVGVVLGIAILYGVAFIIGMLASCGILTGFADALKKSFLGGLLYNHNLIGRLVALVKEKF